MRSWLRSKPWTWHYAVMYRTFRHEQRRVVLDDDGRYVIKVYAPPHGRLRSAWLALTFPHVHDDDE